MALATTSSEDRRKPPGRGRYVWKSTDHKEGWYCLLCPAWSSGGYHEAGQKHVGKLAWHFKSGNPDEPSKEELARLAASAPPASATC